VPITAADLTDLDAHHWELYHIAEDPTENHNLADQHRDRLIEMIAQWYVEAGKYDVLPIDGSAAARLLVERPQIGRPRDRYVYRPGTQTVPAWVSPRVLNRPHSISADVDIPAGGAEGVLLCQGTSAGGWTMYLLDGVLHFAHNYVRRELYRVSAVDPVPAGRHELRFEFEPTGKPDFMAGRGAPGRAQLYLDARLVGQAEFPVTTPIGLNPGGLTCGANPGAPVVPDYRSPFRFTGTLHTVTVDLSGDLISDTEGEMRMAMMRQ
jgi:arylsulfatase